MTHAADTGMDMPATERSEGMAGLLASRRFGPLFATQFLGAFNDNLYRSAMLFLIAFGILRGDPAAAATAAVAAGGVFILPYFLFSSLAGQIADAYPKDRLARYVKLAEGVILLVGGGALYEGSMPLMYAALFAMGMHSTFFGPIKYSMLPQLLRGDELLKGTGMVEAGTFLAILLGQIAGGLLSTENAVGVLLIVCGLGIAASMFIPSAPPTGAAAVDRNIVQSTGRILKSAVANRPLFLSILGISWFFALGGVLTQQFVPLVETMGADQIVATLFLGIFSVGIGIGSVLVHRMLGDEISARYLPAAALALAAGVIDLSFSVAAFRPEMEGMRIADFLAASGSWRMVADLVVISVSAGIYIVPLYALLQTLGDPAARSRDVAANNVVNAVAMVFLSVVTTVLIGAGFSASGIFLVLGLFGLAVAAYACVLLPETVIKSTVRLVVGRLYRVEVVGAENMPPAGTPAVVVVNHVSFLDAALLAAFLPGKPTFAVATRIARAWWMRPLMRLFNAFPVDPTNPMAAKAMVKAVKEGRTLVIFPEGRITVTGALMKVFDGPGMVADKADAPVIPVRIDGAQYTPFSRLRGKVRLRWFPRIRMTVLPPRRFAIEGEMTARARRQIAGRRLYDEMSEMMFATSATDDTLFGALIEASHIHGRKMKIVEDVKREPMSYGRLITSAFALGRVLAQGTARGEAVGVLLPNVNAVAATFFALQAHGRVPAMLNYTAGLANLQSACATARVATIVTARAFIDQAKLGDMMATLAQDHRVVYLEDLAPSVGRMARLRALAASFFARRVHARHGIGADAPAVILFTSGSEGLPKGVVLTHRNLLSNCRQLAARVDFNSSDVVLNALPVFHSFGLTGGTLLPILSGIRTVLYPSPLHYRIVPAFAYDANATILFGTDTFLSGYARMANPYDFYSIRYIFAGAERVRDETRKAYAEKFGLRILEGYGATEASPVLAVNTPMHFKAGTVGRALPSIETRLDPVPGIEGGGRLFIRGPNVMAGYYLADRPGVLQPPVEGWHDTGDIVEIDEQGFIAIKGRAKRFAKIGGEMVSLPAVEGYAAKLWPDADHAVVAVPDPKKGEQLVLYTTRQDATAKALGAWARENGATELMVPRDVRMIGALPVLGTGKIDYVAINAMAKA